MITLRSECPGDAAAIDTLLEAAFGPGHHAKPSSLLRARLSFDEALKFVALEEHQEAEDPGSAPARLLGSLRFTRLTLSAMDNRSDGNADRAVLLLGPLAVTPARQRNGVGLKLMAHGLAAAREAGHDIVFLIGDPGYYAKAGFHPVTPGAVRLPVPFDPARLMVQSLQGTDSAALAGLLHGRPA